ncbi:alpha/beta fold hydrolase [Chitinimonas naiadis]
MYRNVIPTLFAAILAVGSFSSHAATPPATSSQATSKIEDGKLEINGVRYHYLLAKGRGTPIVLLHGWASTSYMWRYVMPQLVARGHTVLAPDIRGLGDTGKPTTGYEKTVVAEDIHALVAKLDLGPAVHVVGHDLGGMVAYAYAAQYPKEVSRLAILDVPLPGIEPWDQITQSPRTWHFRFFAVQDVPEMLIAGHEQAFFKWFHNSEAVNASAFTTEAEDVYARQYAVPGALRAGFEYYRAFPADAKANREFAKQKLTMPVLGLGGDQSFGPIIGEHLKHVAEDVTVVQVANSGHWVAEEQPQSVLEALVKFLPAPGK